MKKMLSLLLCLLLSLSVCAPAFAVNEDVEGELVIYTSMYKEIVDMMDEALKAEIDEGRVVKEEDRLYLRDLYIAERRVAARLRRARLRRSCGPSVRLSLLALLRHAALVRRVRPERVRLSVAHRRTREPVQVQRGDLSHRRLRRRA